MKNNKKKIVIILSIIGILCILIGTSYAINSFLFTGIRNQRIDLKGLSFNYTEQSTGLYLPKLTPLNDTNGLASGNDYLFSVSGTGTKMNNSDYYIFITTDENNTLSNDYVRLNIVNQTTNNSVGPKNISDLRIKEDTDNAYYLIGDKLEYASGTTSMEHTYKLTIWVNEDYTTEAEYSVVNNEQITTIGGESFKFKINVATGPIPEIPPQTILTMYNNGDLHIGDFITYDAGEWNWEEIDSIVVGPNDDLMYANWSLDLPSEWYQFGGFEEGQSRNVGAIELDDDYKYAMMYDGNDSSNQVPLSGWRIFDIDEENEVVTLISAANPEDYYHPSDACASEYILTGQVNEEYCDSSEYDNYTIRDWSMYENSAYNATNARVLTKTDLDRWYSKYILEYPGLFYDTYDYGIEYIYGGSYQNLIDNHTYYWLGSAYDGSSLFYLDPDYRGVHYSDDVVLGVRVLVSIPLTSTIQENPVARRTVTLDGMYWWNGMYGAETVQEYNVWDLAVE